MIPQTVLQARSEADSDLLFFVNVFLLLPPTHPSFIHLSCCFFYEFPHYFNVASRFTMFSNNYCNWFYWLLPKCIVYGIASNMRPTPKTVCTSIDGLWWRRIPEVKILPALVHNFPKTVVRSKIEGYPYDWRWLCCCTWKSTYFPSIKMTRQHYLLSTPHRVVLYLVFKELYSRK